MHAFNPNHSTVRTMPAVLPFLARGTQRPLVRTFKAMPGYAFAVWVFRDPEERRQRRSDHALHLR